MNDIIDSFSEDFTEHFNAILGLDLEPDDFWEHLIDVFGRNPDRTHVLAAWNGKGIFRLHQELTKYFEQDFEEATLRDVFQQSFLNYFGQRIDEINS